MISVKSILPHLLLFSAATANGGDRMLFSSPSDQVGQVSAGFLQDVLLMTAQGRDLRECSVTDDTITCQSEFTLTGGENCLVVAMCPTNYDSDLTLCSCAIEIDGDECRSCGYCSNTAASIDCTGVYQENGCSGINCNGDCIGVDGSIITTRGPGNGDGGDGGNSDGHPLFYTPSTLEESDAASLFATKRCVGLVVWAGLANALLG